MVVIARIESARTRRNPGVAVIRKNPTGTDSPKSWADTSGGRGTFDAACFEILRHLLVVAFSYHTKTDFQINIVDADSPAGRCRPQNKIYIVNFVFGPQD